MSTQARQALVDHPRIVFQNPASQKADLLDPDKTDTYLIALLTQLFVDYTGEITITALNTDHPTYDGGPSGHGHNAGKAVDCWGDALQHFLEALAKNRFCWTVGAGGDEAKAAAKLIQWPGAPFVYFDDNNQPHLHAQSANSAGEGPRP